MPDQERYWVSVMTGKPTVKLRWWLHSQRWKHQSNMAQAHSDVDLALFYKRQSIRHPDEAEELILTGWEHMQAAISGVCECGCPRELWDLRVQENILETW